MQVKARRLCDSFDVTDTVNFQYIALKEDVVKGETTIKTIGSSTTWSAVTASTAPFKGLAQWDVLYVPKPDGTVIIGTIITFTDNDNVVVDTAADLSAGYSFEYKRANVGTGATNGWVDVGNITSKSVEISLETFNLATNVTVQVEGSIDGLPAAILSDNAGVALTKTLTAAGNAIYTIGPTVDRIRVGFKAVGADTGTNYVSAALSGETWNS